MYKLSVLVFVSNFLDIFPGFFIYFNNNILELIVNFLILLKFKAVKNGFTLIVEDRSVIVSIAI